MTIRAAQTQRLEKSSSRFKRALDERALVVERREISLLQVNIGKLCNQTCRHCHVEAGPRRTEIMERRAIDRILELLGQSPNVREVDITGGAPELNPHFRFFVRSLRENGRSAIDRCNLTVLLEPGQEETADFLARQQVKIVASLPCYLEDNVDAQRGRGVFVKSIEALRRLNGLGYGQTGSGLVLNLVYNPLGARLPPDQPALQTAYREHLGEAYGVTFNELFAMTNMPIKRFARMLERDGESARYRRLLIDHFNPAAATEVMCTRLVSIGWDGGLYDCDFNQMLEIPLNLKPRTIWDISSFSALDRGIAFADHCFGCAAGSGSSCTGSLASKKG